ncbi:MAG: EutN/CcmL family microcompartment protein [bacterium]|nr:EutN/CcmL family microcompartment protein [bacterium]
MFLAEVLGSVVATRRYEATRGYRLLWVQPLEHHGKRAGEPEVALDTTLSGPGDRVICVIGREASLAMDPPDRMSPVDLAIVGIVDRVDVGDGKPRRRDRAARARGGD